MKPWAELSDAAKVKRMDAWVMSNGKCGRCGTFLHAETLSVIREHATDKNPVERTVAICPGCRAKLGD